MEAEILLSLDDATTEESGPSAIDDDAGSEWILPADEPASEAEAVLRRTVRQRVENGKNRWLHRIGGLCPFTAVMNEGAARVFRRSLLKHQRGEERGRAAQFVDLFAGGGKLRCAEQKFVFQQLVFGLGPIWIVEQRLDLGRDLAGHHNARLGGK